MHKAVKHLNIQFDILKEGKAYIAYSPALDLSTHAKTVDQVKKRFVEAVELYFESIIKNGKLEETLLNLGWQTSKGSFVPPTIISREVSSFALPAFA